MTTTDTTASAHVVELRRALDDLERSLPSIERLGSELGRVLVAGGRLLVAGNGGSAAQAQHLTAELVGRYQGERVPLSGSSTPARIFSKVDFPAPLGPIRPTRSPSHKPKESPVKRTCAPKALLIASQLSRTGRLMECRTSAQGQPQ